MADINWNESAPAGADSLGLGAGEIRSLKTALRSAVAEEHVFPTSSGPAGIHKLGSARPYYGLQSAVSSSGTDSRIMVTSDTSRLFHVGSNGTMLLGDSQLLSVATATGGAKFYWAIEVGQDNTGNGGSKSVTFPNSGYSGRPFVLATADPESTSSTLYVNLYSITATQFGIAGYAAGGTASRASFQWISIGTRTF